MARLGRVPGLLLYKKACGTLEGRNEKTHNRQAHNPIDVEMKGNQK